MQLYRRLLGYVWHHRWVMAGGIISIFALSFLQILIPQITRYVIDVIIPAQRFEWLPWVELCIIGIAITPLILLITSLVMYIHRRPKVKNCQKLKRLTLSALK
ncbi:MAG: ABC transporter ATP-binding protein [Leptolyngbyaceae cyanobacterium SU_3_3]|nr:ABC transporter ATP-binding protein [Leptolyngbyaceae cyanobacterium SU_3_3]